MNSQYQLQGYRFFLSIGFVCLSLTMAGHSDEPAAKEKRLKVAAIDQEKLRSSSLSEGAWTLRNHDGDEIQAHLVSAHGETVKIQRVGDDREFDVPISTFDSSTEYRIRLWMEEDPDAVNYSLAISAQRNLLDSNDFRSSGKSFKRSKWAYRVTIANETRNDLNHAQVEYRIIYDDNVDFSRTIAIPGAGKGIQDGQAVDLPPMSFNDEIEFTTPPIETHTYEYEPNRGEREFSKDEIKGIWVRIVRHGETIAEFKSNEAAMGSYTWDSEGEVEIKITNRFRESFESTDSEE